MAELIQRDGTWDFDGERLRLVPGTGRGVHPLRAGLGEIAVPLEAVAGISLEPGRRRARLRLRLREGADPLDHACSGRLADDATPYALAVEPGRTGAAEYLVDEVRTALVLESVAVDEAVDRWLLPGPSVPRVVSGGDGKVTFDGHTLRIEWGWACEESKKSAGTRMLPLRDVAAVEWSRARWESGWFRIRPVGPVVEVKPSHDPNCVTLWGLSERRETAEVALLAAAVTARLPHPRAGKDAGGGTSGGADGPAPVPLTKPPVTPGSRARDGEVGGGTGHDPDAVLRRLRELGELRSSGVLTEEEFTRAKRALLDRL
ncbi:DUF4429 domain-containing protein [Streptomyces alkaliphilus]|uniref:DUF4429 domain-containing protein n=1 Tax=Streptomyces alkaliphilus TaxID=1472722 RepID=UPI001180B8B2|nr:DUF4429 domain-containing protein [Streptomyces alkaliphilus]MQS06342.1 DUF4429 domain-containing protein [Streptomyces alkaliphilus]